MKVGSFVKSSYRSKWTGIVLSITKRRKITNLMEVLILKDRNNNDMVNMKIVTISEFWLSETEPILLTDKQKRWLRGN